MNVTKRMQSSKGEDIMTYKLKSEKKSEKREVKNIGF